MEIRLLGAVAAADSAGDVALGGAKQRAVLAWLALHAPRTCSVSGLVDAVWGDDPPASARNALQVYVSGLRKVLVDGVDVEHVGDGYRLCGVVDVDATAFRERSAAGRAALRAGDGVRAERLLGAALELWGGDPLDGLSGVAFRDSVGAGLVEARVAALRDHAAALLLCGRPGEAARSAQAALDAMPYDERAWSLLATARYDEGRQQDALDVLRELRARLVDELGLDPSPGVVELERQILEHAVPRVVAPPGRSATASSEGVPAPRLPSLVTPFVGRSEEVDRVVAALRSGRLVSIVGLGGIGKTTVAIAACHRLAGEGHAVVFCELETQVEAVPALERVCQQLGVDAGDDPVAALADVPGPRVLVLDNTEQVRGLGRALSAVLGNPGLRVVLTSRRALHLRDEHVIPVGPLAVESRAGAPSPAAELVLARVTDPAPGPPDATTAEAAERLASLLDGIPLAIEIASAHSAVLGAAELARRLEAGRLSALDAGREVDRPARQGSLAVVLAATVEMLDQGTLRLAGCLTACDGWTTLDLLERVAGESAGSVLDAVEGLREVGLAEVDGQGRVRLRTVVREFLVGAEPDLEPLERQLVSQVRALVEAASPRLQGTEAETTLRLLARDHDPVTGALARCVANGWSADAAAITVGLNLYWLKGARLAEGRRWIEAAAAMPGHTDVDRARLRMLEGTFLTYFADPAGGPLLEASLREAAQAGAPLDRLVVNGWCSLAALHAFRGEPGPAREQARRAVELADGSGDPMLVALARDAWAYVAAVAGDHESALDANLAGVVDARRMGDRYLVVSSLNAVVENLAQLERFDEAAEVSDDLFEEVRLLEPGPVLSQVLVIHALTRLGTGEVSAAKGCLVEALRVIRDRFPNRIALADALMALAATLAVEGRDRDAARAWAASDTIFEQEAVDVQTHLFPLLARTRSMFEERVPPARMTAWRLGGLDPDRVVDELVAE